jgi:kynurenine formamidase
LDGTHGTAPSIDTVRAMAQQYRNWGRWGDDDQRGTLNHVTPDDVRAAAALVVSGTAISMALPYDEHGPQSGHFGRFNPIRLMTRDGGDAVMGTTARDFYKGPDRHFQSTDDIIIMPLQCGTQWDSLAHIVFEGRLYNGYGADEVTSAGAFRNDVRQGSDAMVGRGVLLDMPRALGVEWLEPGHAISGDELDRAAAFGNVEVRRGDYVFVRTGAIARARAEQSWGAYSSGPAPGPGLASVAWVADHEVAAMATDTWGFEVQPNETPDVMQPLHIILLNQMGLWIGEIFDLEAVSGACAADGRYAFFFCGPPLPFTRGVGSPLNPMAIK